MYNLLYAMHEQYKLHIQMIIEQQNKVKLVYLKETFYPSYNYWFEVSEYKSRLKLFSVSNANML